MSAAPSNADVPVIYKRTSFESKAESKLGLDNGISVVDGKLQENSEQPIPLPSALHTHLGDSRKSHARKSQFQFENPEEHHTQHHVHIGQEVNVQTFELSPPKVSQENIPNEIPTDITDDDELKSNGSPRRSNESLKGKRKRSSLDAKIFENEATRDTRERRLSKRISVPKKVLNLEDETEMREIIERSLENAQERNHRKVQINKSVLKRMQDIFTRDAKQDLFLESVLASQHVKELTSRYGSKAKNVRQFFLEAVDADTKLAIYGATQTAEVQETLQKLKEKRFRTRIKSIIKLDEDDDEKNNRLADLNLDDSETESTVYDEKRCVKEKEDKEPLFGVWSKKNFWESLERLELEQEGNQDRCADEKGNPLFEIYGSKWRRHRKMMGTGGSSKRDSIVSRQELESYPDKYLVDNKL